MATAQSAQDWSRRLRRVDAPAVKRQVNPLLRIFPVILLGYAVLVPVQAHVMLAGLRIDAPQMVCLALLPWMLARLAKGALRPGLVDALVFLTSSWMIISFAVWYGPAEGIVRGSALAINVLLPYLVARLAISDLNDIRRLLVVMLPGFLIAGLFMMAEALSHRLIVAPLFEAIFGQATINRGGEAFGTIARYSEIRLGMLRAMGPFAHPILAGILMASLLPLYKNSGLRSWPYLCGVAVGFFAIFSVSSGAFLALLLAITLLGYDWLQRRVVFLSWPMMIITVSLAALAIELAPGRGLLELAARATLTPSTAYNRIRILEFGMLAVEQYPWFGRGFTAIERLEFMPESIDNHWILLAVRHGAICSLAAIGASLAAVWGVTRRKLYANDLDHKLGFALGMTVFILLFCGFTVAYFASSGPWYWMITGMAAAIMYAATGDRPGRR